MTFVYFRDVWQSLAPTPIPALLINARPAPSLTPMTAFSPVSMTREQFLAARNLRLTRTDYGWSREELRRRLAQDPIAPVVYADTTTIAKMEKGQMAIPRAHVETFARALGIPVSNLLGLDDPCPWAR